MKQTTTQKWRQQRELSETRQLAVQTEEQMQKVRDEQHAQQKLMAQESQALQEAREELRAEQAEQQLQWRAEREYAALRAEQAEQELQWGAAGLSGQPIATPTGAVGGIASAGQQQCTFTDQQLMQIEENRKKAQQIKESMVQKMQASRLRAAGSATGNEGAASVGGGSTSSAASAAVAGSASG